MSKVVKEPSEFDKLVLTMNDEEYQIFIDSLSEEEQISLMYDLEWQGRPKQQLPTGDWATLIVVCGRGWGKDWFGSKVIGKWAKTTENIALIGDNIGEVRDVMIDGPSGILKLARPDFYPDWNKTTSTLVYPNGCKVKGYSGQDPESLRGPNNGKAWVDELFKMRYQVEVMEELDMTMRSGDNPQTLITSTPRPTALCKALVKAPSTVVIRGTTYENYKNNKRFTDQTIAKYEGTRRGRQELYGEILEDNPGALFKTIDIDPYRVKSFIEHEDKTTTPLLHEMDRVVVAVDPATTANAETSDENGIVICGRKGDHGYVFADESLVGTPNEWGQKAVECYRTFKADRIVAEVNQGGLMVEATIRNVDTTVSYKGVRATRGKALRAEPIAALYEQHRIHHVGYFGELEQQMLDFDPALGRNQKSPDRLDALVWALTELFGETIKTPSIHYL
jgi:phage terminase large subunit-like protein